MSNAYLNLSKRPLVFNEALTRSNREGLFSFLCWSTLYPKLSLILCVLLTTMSLHATELPNAPTPASAPVYGAMDWSLAGSLVAARFADFTSTEQCLRRPYSQCHEIELPRVIAGNKAAFATFELTATGLSLFEQYQLTKRGHRKLARTIQFANVGILSVVVQHNYRLAGASLSIF